MKMGNRLDEAEKYLRAAQQWGGRSSLKRKFERMASQYLESVKDSEEKRKTHGASHVRWLQEESSKMLPELKMMFRAYGVI